jgi:hypothetical protein
LATEEWRIELDEQRLAKEKKMEEQRLALEFEKLAKEKEEAKLTIMFMNPNSMDATERA